jgi:hypothetical protein
MLEQQDPIPKAWLSRGLRIATTGVCFAAPVLVLLVLVRDARGPVTLDAATRSQPWEPDEARPSGTGFTPMTSRRDFAAFLAQVNGANTASKACVFVPVYAVGEGQGARPQLAVRTCVVLPRRATPQERFEEYLRWLGRHVHGGNRIVPVRFDEKGAVVDLRAPQVSVDGYTGDYWHRGFQGSAGGGYTETELLLNLTQPRLDLDWPRQIEVRYQGGPCEFDHTSYLDTAVRREVMWNRLAAWPWKGTGG